MVDNMPPGLTLGPVEVIVNETAREHGIQAYTHPNANGLAAEIWISGPRIESFHICSYDSVQTDAGGVETFLVVQEANVSPERALTHLMTRWGEIELIR